MYIYNISLEGELSTLKLCHFAVFFDITKTIKILFLALQGPFSFTLELKRFSGSKGKRSYNATV